MAFHEYFGHISWKTCNVWVVSCIFFISVGIEEKGEAEAIFVCWCVWTVLFTFFNPLCSTDLTQLYRKNKPKKPGSVSLWAYFLFLLSSQAQTCNLHSHHVSSTILESVAVPSVGLLLPHVELDLVLSPMLEETVGKRNSLVHCVSGGPASLTGVSGRAQSLHLLTQVLHWHSPRVCLGFHHGSVQTSASNW